jgi:hypothetical protein
MPVKHCWHTFISVMPNCYECPFKGHVCELENVRFEVVTAVPVKIQLFAV